jgi:hypothetical protein
MSLHPVRQALFLLLAATCSLDAQVAHPAVSRVVWPLVDVVLVPDTCYGIWLLAAPNTGTTEWTKGVQVVSFSVDPVTLLQWAGAVQRLVQTPEGVPAATPRLQNRRGDRFMLVANSMAAKVRANERHQLLVVDSTTRTRWKTYATTEELERLTRTIENVVARAPALTAVTDSSLVVDDKEPDVTPAVQLKVPRPSYPVALRRKPAGRVWTEYVVGTDGRVEQGSIRILLADHDDFASAAVSSLEQATFRPATRRGIPVRQRVFQPVSFRWGS